jgi:hypothetical protein
MANIIQLLRSATFGRRPAAGSQPVGMPYVNFADKQFGVVDSSQAPQDLIGVPFFSTAANYNAGQCVNYQGQLYVASSTVTAGAWNSTNWTLVATQAYADASRGTPTILSINGGFNISQELGFGLTVTGLKSVNKYFCDQWLATPNGNPVVSAGAVGNGVGQILVTTAVPTLAAGDYLAMTQPIEGLRTAYLLWGSLGALPITISFFVQTSITGTITVSVCNTDGSRTYLVDVPVTAGNTWQWVSVVVPGDTTGTWKNDNTVGMFIRIGVAAGSTYRGGLGWNSVNVIGTNNTMNLCATVNNTVYVYNFLVTGGGTPLIGSNNVKHMLPSYQSELDACNRYWNATWGNMRWRATAANEAHEVAVYWPRMRVTPSITLVGGTNGNLVNGSLVIATPTDRMGRLSAQAVAIGDAYSLQAQLLLNARM